ncbi:hypothetical protein SBV1_1340003 [Verrucomicrobia bacterium]|nr:hypothetical protein SBV1_1340003 [Verrucomicrobiota bacterium]
MLSFIILQFQFPAPDVRRSGSNDLTLF